jgi:hypothetical protein
MSRTFDPVIEKRPQDRIPGRPFKMIVAPWNSRCGEFSLQVRIEAGSPINRSRRALAAKQGYFDHARR